ncbi:MAG: plasmid recombination protein, partial [Mailhella sp.]|nr:plasmid recombination protein [Mailhella sp.]
GRENVISAMIHMDEKTPHMHFLHVPVTPDGRLNANAIYTRESLRRLQSELPEHFQKCGFRIERGVEQVPGARRIHLNTREFKQEKEERERIAADNVKVLRHALDALYAANELEEHLKGKIKEYEKQAREAERYLARNEELPEASMFNFKTVLAQAKRVIAEQKRALAEKAILEGRKQIADGLLAERNSELKEQALRIDRLLRELEDLKAQKLKADDEARAFKEFIAQPDEKPRFEKFLADKQEEELRAEMARQTSLTTRKPTPAHEDDGPSFSFR